MNSKGEFYHVN